MNNRIVFAKKTGKKTGKNVAQKIVRLDHMASTEGCLIMALTPLFKTLSKPIVKLTGDPRYHYDRSPVIIDGSPYSILWHGNFGKWCNLSPEYHPSAERMRKIKALSEPIESTVSGKIPLDHIPEFKLDDPNWIEPDE